jgi:hypothetical protein
MRGLTETALNEGCGRGLMKRPLNNNRTSNNTSCGVRDSAEVIVVDGGRDSAEVIVVDGGRDSAGVA